MTNVLIIGSLDRFGSESVATLLGYLQDSSRYKELLHRNILHLWLGGGQPPPHPECRQGSRVPLWTLDDKGNTATLVRPDVGPDFNRREFMDQAANQFKPLLAAILNELPSGKVGNGQFDRVILALVGSAADPRSTATALALLRCVFNHATFSGNCVPSLFLSLNPECITRTDFEGVMREDAALNSSTGINLLDVEAFLSGTSTSAGRKSVGLQPLAPVFLSGNGTRAGPKLTREDSRIEIAGALVGLVQTLFIEPGERANPLFEFGYDTSSPPSPTWRGEPFDPKTPFAVVGAATAVFKRELVLDLVSFRICERVLSFYLARSKDSSTSLPPEFLDQNLGALVRRTQERMQKKGYAPKEAGTFGTFSTDWLDRFLGWKNLYSNWQEKVNSAFGWSRIQDIPLEYWEQALLEFREVTELYFATERQRYFQQFGWDFLHALDPSVGDAFNDLCQTSWAKPVAFHPNQAAKEFLGYFQQSLETSQSQWNRDQLKAVAAGEDAAELSKRAEEKYKRLLELMKSIPSPLAVWLRALPVVGLAVLLFKVIPLGALDSWPGLRLASGLGAGAAFAGWMFSRVWSAKRRLRTLYEDWLSAYCSMLEQTMQADFSQWKKRFFELARAYCGWLQQPAEKTWLPIHSFPGLKEFLQPFPTDCLPQSGSDKSKYIFLFGFQDRLQTAQGSFATLAKQCKGYFHLSRLEKAMPKISGSGEDYKCEDELVSWSQTEEHISAFLGTLQVFARDHSTATLPFLVLRRPGVEADTRASAEWKGDFKMTFPLPANDAEFLNSDLGRFFASVRSYAENNTPSCGQPLTERIRIDYYEDKDWSQVSHSSGGDGEFWKLQELGHAKMENELRNQLMIRPPEILGPETLPPVLIESWKPLGTEYQHLVIGELLVLLEGVCKLEANHVIYGIGGKKSPSNLIGVCLANLDQTTRSLPGFKPGF